MEEGRIEPSVVEDREPGLVLVDKRVGEIGSPVVIFFGLRDFEAGEAPEASMSLSPLE